MLKFAIRKSATLALTVMLAAVTFDMSAPAHAQKLSVGRSPGGFRPDHGGGGGGLGGFGTGAAIGLGVGVIGGVIANTPPAVAGTGGRFIDNPNIVEDVDIRRPRIRQPRPPQAPRPPVVARVGGGIPPAGETRLIPDEIVLELSSATPPRTVDALQRRYRLERLESATNQLAGTTLYRWRIPDRRSVPAVIRTLEANNAIVSAQPNYVFRLQQTQADTTPPQSAPQPANETPDAAAQAAPTPASATSDTVAPPARIGDPAQYALGKMHVPEALALASGADVRVAVIDSGVDVDHPDLNGAVVGTFDAVKAPMVPHAHGTAIAALIAGHGKLSGTAPGARILAIRAFNPGGDSGDTTTFNILKGLDWAVANGARVINMSFAGPYDPAIHRAIAAATKKGIVSIAAAGNAGPKSPPLYPAAEPAVIAVGATDADNKIFAGSNRGRHIAVTAPGVDIFVAAPGGGYQVSSGTSFSAAEVSGIVALMLQRNPNLTPGDIRKILMSTANDLGPAGPDDDFGAGLADAYRAVNSETPRVSDVNGAN